MRFVLFDEDEKPSILRAQWIEGVANVLVGMMDTWKKAQYGENDGEGDPPLALRRCQNATV